MARYVGTIERTATSAQIRAGLSHPVVDSDGHWVEYHPVMIEALRKIGGDTAVDGYGRFANMLSQNLAMTAAERRARNLGHESFWGVPSETLDRATAMMPALLNDRLDEFGIDFTVLYPTQGLGVVNVRDDEPRRAACRAYNTFAADYFAGYADRMTPAAVIPMFTPEEAIDELNHAVGEMGMKVAMFGSMIPRPLPDGEGVASEGHAVWLDLLGIDSLYDYDPVWQRCVELGISPSFHAAGKGPGFGLRAAPSNFTYNHIGHFATADEAVCKALFFGGVTRRFPDLRFAFLEGGAAWACQLLHDIVEHWEVRGSQSLDRLNPRRLDSERLDELAQKYGTDAMKRATAARRTRPSNPAEGLVGGRPAPDDFAACEIERVEDIADLFVKPFWFGCEAEDRLATWAFRADNNEFGSRLHATLGSDIGHFDVSDMSRVLVHAHQLVDTGLMTDADFQDFSFTNAVRLFGGGNPSFFKGTVVEKAAAAVLTTEAG